MKDIVVLPCECGREMRATNPAPGSTIRCFYCGNSKIYQSDGSVTDDFPDLPVPVEQQPSWIRELMVCKMCGAKVEIKYSGPQGKDRLAVCKYCGTETDLPESRRNTELVESRAPDGTVTKRKIISSVSMSGGEHFEFDTIEDMMKSISKDFPQDMADDIHKNIDEKSSDPNGLTTSYTTKMSTFKIHSNNENVTESNIWKWFRKK